MLTSLWASRKFRIAVFDVAVAIILHFGAEFLPQAVMADVNWFILASQPILISLILGIAIVGNAMTYRPKLERYANPDWPKWRDELLIWRGNSAYEPRIWPLAKEWVVKLGPR